MEFAARLDEKFGRYIPINLGFSDGCFSSRQLIGCLIAQAACFPRITHPRILAIEK